MFKTSKVCNYILIIFIMHDLKFSYDVYNYQLNFIMSPRKELTRQPCRGVLTELEEKSEHFFILVKLFTSLHYLKHFHPSQYCNFIIIFISYPINWLSQEVESKFVMCYSDALPAMLEAHNFCYILDT